MFDVNKFYDELGEKANSQSFDENLDMALSVCMIELCNYKDHCDANNTDAKKFEICIEAFTSVMYSRFDLDKIKCDEYIEKCNSLLEELQQEEPELFDECVNITCEIMHTLAYISTRDNRNISAILKLLFESSEFYLQRNNVCENEEEYEEKIVEIGSQIKALNVSSLTRIHNAFGKTGK